MRHNHKTNRFHLESLEHRRLLSFSVAGDYVVGNGPNDVVIADFNGDGRADLATINGDNISVLLGNGAGGFAAAQHFPTSVGGSSIDLESGDLNGDGKVDLAAAGPGLVLLFGNGNGSFGAAQVVSTPPGPPESYGTTVSDVEVADVNADGKSDLVYGFYYTFANEEFNYYDSYVGVSLGNGNGAFAAPAASYWVGTAPGNGLAAADLNGDSKLDVAASTWQETPGQDNVAILIGLGNGAFSEAQSIPLRYGARHGVPSNGLAIGDFDADGNADLAKTDEHYGIFVLMGNGDGTFDETIANYWAGQIPQSVDAADFNRDGKLDLLTGNYFHTVSLLPGNGDGTFAAPIDYAAAPGTPAYVNFGAAAGDFNNDGRPDVAAVSHPYYGEPNPPDRQSNVRVLLNDGNWGGVPTPPTVTDVFVSGTAWTSGYRNFLQSSGAGEAAFGHRFGPTPQSQTIGYSNLNQIGLRFDKAATVDATDLLVSGVNVASYGVTAFAYDPATFTATWTLSRTIPNDKVTFALDLDATPGADYTSSVRVLPGDIDRNGSVNVFDFNVLKPNLNQSNRGVAGGDINGDGVVNVFDFNDLKSYLGRTAPQ